MSDVYVVIHVATTCDEQGVYVTRDSAETIEIAWSILDSSNLQEIIRESVLIRPVNTPITALCTTLTTLTWEHVRDAGSFKDAVHKLDQSINEYVISKNLDFTFVTLNSWDLRVQLPREARDKSVVLPAYLQHAKLFDLKQEYSKWQIHHPETLSYSASNLTNIITALEVDLSNLSFHFNNNTQQGPRNASEEVEIVAKVLTSLIAKCKPVENHPDVLTRPFDARADVCAFLVERSKVLHLSNLPQDTTQSELESWFTQYGGRPIAFWTLKTPDQHKSIGLGFAVFSSHEEAAESLAMNGRALNDKCVEVQPSSARVLDRAQEILTPFPPSKNRPRPGDWTCPSCGFSNFQRRTACFRCSFPAASAAAIQESMYSQDGNSSNSANGNTNSNGGNAGFVPQSQQSQQAQTQQQPHQQHQQHHFQHQQAHHPQQHQQSQQQSQQHHGHNHGSHHHHPHNSNNTNGSGRSSVPFRAGDWKCASEGCAYHNFAKNICCLRCGAPRVTNTNTAISNVAGVQLPQQPSQGMLQQQQQQHQHQHQQHQSHPQQQQQQQFYPSQLYNTETSNTQLTGNGTNGEIGDLSNKIGGILINQGN